MIISKTPLRVSFVGGGTDLKDYYRKDYGAVLSTAIDKYIYVLVNRKFDSKIRISYSKTELADSVDEVQHELVREAMKLTGVTDSVEIVTVADIPSSGTGLGSSSSLAVGLLNALYAYKGESAEPEQLAKQACDIEINRVKEPIGKQDQYIAAYGGMQYIRFMSDESVSLDPVVCTQEAKNGLNENLLMFYTGLARKANTILAEQKKNTDNKRHILDRMRDLAKELKEILEKGDLDAFGRALHENWELKKQLTSEISNPLIDTYYEKAVSAGAAGGKILGAGGGGFLLLYCKRQRQENVRDALSELKELSVSFEAQGSRIVYRSD